MHSAHCVLYAVEVESAQVICDAVVDELQRFAGVVNLQRSLHAGVQVNHAMHRPSAQNHHKGRYTVWDAGGERTYPGAACPAATQRVLQG